ncbi:unnamed protein product [Rotaria socialis]|uniref:Uncharacterized protein n=1 Tax=Rotaria socialis TaxID=392032 RepID=A0A818EHD5_9BILA|nr:unnamed protein product [Rotaria socialis]
MKLSYFTDSSNDKKNSTSNMSDLSLQRPSKGHTHKGDRRLSNLLYRKSKLESVNETSALLSGFEIVAIVELSLDSYKENNSSNGLIICYAIVSCLLVGIHLLALLMSMLSGFSQTAAIAALVTLCLVGCPFILFAIGFCFRVTRAKVHFHQTDLENMERGAIARGLFMNNPNVPLTSLATHVEENS